MYTVFTHRDHIGCHADWHQAFPNAKRVIHEADMVVNDHGDTSGFEVVLSGFGGKREWTLPGCVCLYVCMFVCVYWCIYEMDGRAALIDNVGRALINPHYNHQTHTGGRASP